MPKFLTQKEIYKLLRTELPDGAYADSGRPEDFLTTSSLYAKAGEIKDLYSNMERIYANYFPQSADEKIDDWEIKVFGELVDAGYSLEKRIARILAKIRSRKGIRKSDVAELVQTILGEDVEIEIIELSSSQGGWELGVSELGITTNLSGIRVVSPTGVPISGPDLWEKDAAYFGLTEDELEEIKREAYGYIVKIINYEATEEELNRIETLLNKYEPARSWHVTLNNQTTEEATFDWYLGFSELGIGTIL